MKFTAQNEWAQNMNIGEASETTGLPAKTILYYEDIKLVKPSRGANVYRDHENADIHRLAFVQHFRSLGFTIEECRSSKECRSS